MRIAIVNNCIPFIYGGAELLADNLKKRLMEHGHQSMILRIPFAWDPPPRILDHMLSCRLLRLDNIDRIIALKFPAYYIDHPDKVLWLVHQFRQVYDLWGTPYQYIPNSPEGLKIRDIIKNNDTRWLGAINKRFAISRLVSDRLAKFNQVRSDVLYPPLDDHDKFHCHEYGDYVFYPSRIVRSKRQDLAVESMKHVKSGVKLVIAGNPDSKGETEHLEARIREANLGDRVRIIPRWISQEEKIELFANSLGCLFVPYDEDYGYVSLEAFYSKKPIITCTDSGGPMEFVDHMINGFAVAPEANAIAGAIDSLYQDKRTAKKMGRSGYDKIRSMNMSWENVVRQLTE